MDYDRRLTIGLISEIKRELKGYRFDSNEAVEAMTTKALNGIPETDFQRAFDEWQSHRTKCIDTGGMYFEDYKVIVMIPAINFDFLNQLRYLLNGPCICLLILLQCNITGQQFQLP